MKLKSFRIFRYKSIIDSGECALSSDFSILIGKNESGKSAVLEALRDFDREHHGISQEAVSINGMHANPELELTFEITPENLDAALKEAGASISEDAKQKLLKTGLTLRKTFNGEYRFLDPIVDEFLGQLPEIEQPENATDHITAKKQRLSEILDVYPVPDIKFGQDVQALQESISELRRLVKTRINFVNDEAQKIEAVEILHAMTNSQNVKAKPATARDKFISGLVQLMPRFVYFSDFKDLLPFEISIDALKSNQTVCDFAALAQLNLDDVITTQDVQRRINLLNRASAKISGDFFNHWEQDRIELIARPEGNKILFGVKELLGTDFYKMEQRSRGFQWFLSFYLRVNRYHRDNVVLLIDEPGMNLHPLAQKNILSVMQQQTRSHMQIIFSTHSPSLIDINKLDRINCIVKNKTTGSVIIKGMSSAVDYETLMPVATAAGVNSLEKVKLLFSGEKLAKEPQTTVVSEISEVKQPVVSAMASIPSQNNVRQALTSEAVVQSKKISTKADQNNNKEDEEDLDDASRKPFFKFFGR